MEKIRAAVVGYGNIGRYVVETLRVSPDFEIAGVIRRNGSENCPSELHDLKVVKDVKELDELASSVPDCGGVYIVPAFSGLFAPHWRSDARGVIAGLTGYVSRAHICRAVLEATAFQANDIFEAVEADSGIKLSVLKVDGGLTNSAPLMAFQADILSIPVIRPKIIETTALGAAYAAGLSAGIWQNLENLSSYWKEQLRWTPGMEEDQRQEKILFWRKAVSRTLNWAEKEE